MPTETEIHLGRGVGELLFGSSRDEVRAYLGEPEEIRYYSFDDAGKDRTEAWDYDQRGISAHFDAEEDYMLGTLDADSDTFTLNGVALVGRTKKEVLAAVSALDLGPMETEDMSSQESPDRERVGFDSASLNLWFEDGLLESIQWGPFWIDEDHRAWPK